VTDYLVRIADVYLLELHRQAAPERVVHIEWGEPDEQGVYSPTIRSFDPKVFLAQALNLYPADLGSIHPDTIGMLATVSRGLLLGTRRAESSTPDRESSRGSSVLLPPARARMDRRDARNARARPGRTTSPKEATNGK